MDTKDNQKNRKSNNEPIDQREKLLKNVKLSDLASQFESALDRVQELDLHHLIEPIRSTAEKLRQLEEITEKLACDQYENYPCANKHCCNELTGVISDNKNETVLQYKSSVCTESESDKVSDKISDEKSSSLRSCSSKDSCICYNSNRSKYCRCGSAETVEIISEKQSVLTATRSKKVIKEKDKEKDKEKEINGKCSPCKCSFDKSGKRTKTLDCKLAARARKRKRDDESRRKYKHTAQLLNDELNISTTSGTEHDEDVILERRISNSRFGLQTNFNDLSLAINKENTTIQDKAYMRVKERDQATFCDLSSESSADENRSDKNCANEPHCSSTAPTWKYSSKKVGSWKYDENQVSCGCGEQSNESDKESLYCPCGCGDMMGLSSSEGMQRLKGIPSDETCCCDNCGKEIEKSYSLECEVGATLSVNDSLQRESTAKTRKIEKSPADCCVIPCSDDLRMYIENLKAQCREKDNIILELSQNRGTTRPPTYIT